jgi:gliding motility-associated-like protein
MPACFKNIVRLIVCFVVLPLAGICQVVPIVPAWVSGMGGASGNAISTIMKLDAQNNSYITGYFSGTVDFDPSPGVKNLISKGGSIDIFIAKYDTNGSLVWVVSLGGDGDDEPNGLDFDSNGNISITGVNASTDFDADPGPGVATLASAGGNDTFIVHITNTGGFLWAKSIGGSGNDFGSKVAVDHGNNVIVASQFQSTVTVGGSPYVASGITDGLLTKYDASGNLLWAFHFDRLGASNPITNVIADNNDNITISGSLNGTVDFNPLGIATYVTGNGATFIAQYSSSGILNWSNVILGNAGAINMALDAQNNIYIDGTFSTPINFGSATPLSPKGLQDVFIAKYNQNGFRQFYKGIGGIGASAAGYGIAVSADNNIYVSGYLNGTVDFDPSINTANLTYHGQGDLFLGKYDANGNYQWAFNAGSSNCNNTSAQSVSVDTNNDLILTGSFCSIVNFDASGCTLTTSTAQGVRDMFIAKYATTTLVNNNIITAPTVNTFCYTGDPAVITGSLPTGGNGVYLYQWQESNDNVTFNNVNLAAFPDFEPQTISATTYYRRMVTSSNCAMPVASNVITITVTPAVTNNVITTQSASFCGPAFSGDITGTSAGGAGYSYQWQQSTDNNTFTDITGATGLIYNAGLVSTTTYYRRQVISGSCNTPSPSNVVTITISTGALAKVSAGSTICFGSSVTLTASGGTKYDWTPIAGLSANNIAAPVATPLVTTTYKVIVANNGCPDSATVTITVIPKPNVDAGPDKIVLKGDKVQLAGKVTGSNVQYSWSPTTYLDDPAILNPTATPTESITYTLTATSDQGCAIETDKVTINVYEKVVVPNTFTPNGDGTNDTWNIAAINAYTGSVITVYNREGVPVFKSIGYNKNWDGTFKGKLLPFGTYYYVIDLKDGNKPISGWLAIVK